MEHIKNNSIIKKIALALSAIGPAIFMIGYNIGTGSITTLISAGSTHQMHLMWVLVFACFVTYVMLIAYQQFTLVTGETAMRGYRKHLPLGGTLAIMIIVIMAIGEFVGIAGITGIVSNIIKEWTSMLFGNNGLSPLISALIIVVGSFIFLWNGQYTKFEKFLIFFVVLMGVSFIMSLFIVKNPALIFTTLTPTIPKTNGDGASALLLIASIAGTTAGAILYVMRSTVVAEKGWTVKDLKQAKKDAFWSAFLMLSLSLTIMALATANTDGPVTKVIDMMYVLSTNKFIMSVFVIGVVSAGISTIFPIALILPWLISDYTGKPRNTKSPMYRTLMGLALIVALVVPVFGGRPVAVLILAGAIQVIVLPVATIAIMILVNNDKLMGEHKANKWLNIGLFITLLYSLFTAYAGSVASYNEISNYFGKKEIVSNNYFNSNIIGTGYEGIATTPSVEKPYVPQIVINENRVIYVAPDSIGDGNSETTPTSFQDAVNRADSGYSIIALDGTYNIKVVIDTLKYVNIIAKNKWGAKIIPSGTRSDEAAFTCYSRNDIHHVSFIGLEVMGGEDGMQQFIFSPGTLIKGSVHHIYISDIKMNELKMGIYSGLNSHDWTVDRCQYNNSRMSYLWYCMGFHQTVMNTLMYNNPYLSIAIRGHYPTDEDYIWNGQNTYIKDRTEPFLKKDDWTHLIINNTFGTVTNTNRPNEGMLGLFYDIVPGEETESEACYFPPQNIIIANNVFVDNGPQNKVPFNIYASRGINTGEIVSVNGICFKNNVTSQSKMILEGNTTDISKITDTANIVINAKNINFADEKQNDYHLTANSVDLINRGAEDLYKSNVDCTGNPRDNKPDIGAFEYKK
jgi:Mn2+/Fe2+ NRAMP family transporter